MGAQQTGDWARARQLLAAAPSRLQAAITSAIEGESQVLRDRIVSGLTSSGGQALTPLAASTLAARRIAGTGGSRALVRTGALRDAVVARVSGKEAFGGVSRKAGHGGLDTAALAQLHESGAGPFVVRLSPKARRFLFATLGASGAPRTSQGQGTGVAVIRSPPRPFLRPAFEADRNGAPERVFARVARSLGWGR